MGPHPSTPDLSRGAFRPELSKHESAGLDLNSSFRSRFVRISPLLCLRFPFEAKRDRNENGQCDRHVDDDATTTTTIVDDDDDDRRRPRRSTTTAIVDVV